MRSGSSRVPRKSRENIVQAETALTEALVIIRSFKSLSSRVLAQTSLRIGRMIPPRLFMF